MKISLVWFLLERPLCCGHFVICLTFSSTPEPQNYWSSYLVCGIIVYLFVELYFIRPSLWLCLSLVVADCLPTVSTHPVHHSTWHKITMYHSASHCITVHCRISQCITLQHTTSQCIAENHIVLQFVTPCSNACPQCQPTHSQEPTTVHHSASQCITANQLNASVYQGCITMHHCAFE